MLNPLDISMNLSDIPTHGRFGAKRKYDYHTGIDIYCNNCDPVYALEDGIVINIVEFTGFNETPWWEDTYAILIKSKSGVILYGEIYKPNFNIGDVVKKHQHIANVKKVLKKDKGLPMCMLHLELYESNYNGSGEVWIDSKPKMLLNIEEILEDKI